MDGAEIMRLANEIVGAAASMTTEELNVQYGPTIEAMGEDQACWLRVGMGAAQTDGNTGLVNKATAVISDIYNKDMSVCSPESEQQLARENALKTFGPGG